MPELPEIECIKNFLRPLIRNCYLNSVIIYNNKLRYPIKNDVSLIKNQLILDVVRIAKAIVLRFNNGNMFIHLGMSGYIKMLKNNKYPKKHDHLDLILDNEYILRYNDVRRFGYILWLDNFHLNKIKDNLGVDPLLKKFNFEYLFKKIRTRKTTIKKIIMDNKIITGIGNIYANEILFLSRIMPMKMINNLNCKELKNLIRITKSTLRKSICLGGSTIKNFILPNGKTGTFQKEFHVYGRNLKSCKICNNKIQKIILHNRSTFFCSFCQN